MTTAATTTDVTIPTYDSPPADRVRFGALEMDRLKPDWFTLIDLERLNISNTLHCIIGQIFGDFDYVDEELDWGVDETVIRGVDLHFDGLSLHGTYTELDELWKVEISNRINAAKETGS